nr:hypothetical protein GCM10020092_034140 [Actinoplanes digitatis]
MPELTMLSAMPRINDSLMLQKNVFQLFHPIGGVRPTPFSRACAGEAAVETNAVPDSSRSPAASMVLRRLMGYRPVQTWLAAAVQVHS